MYFPKFVSFSRNKPCAAGTDAVAQCDNDPMDMAGVPR